MESEGVTGEFEVVQDVLVLRADHDGDEVVVELGPAGGEPFRVRYRFGSADEAARHLAQLRRWFREATPVTFVRRRGHVALVHEPSLFADVVA